MTLLRTVLFVVAVGALAACGDPTKHDIIEKAQGADTKAKLEAAVGKPTDVSKLGPLEKWVYKASDGTVVFLITGDTVTLQATAGN